MVLEWRLLKSVSSQVPKNVFRAMRKGGDGRPRCGPGGRLLGVRLPDAGLLPEQRPDIVPDPDTNVVSPGGGGMSVSPDAIENLPPFLKPERLGGPGKYSVFRLELASLPRGLVYSPDKAKPGVHGFIEPAKNMDAEEYQNLLCSTAVAWVEES